MPGGRMLTRAGLAGRGRPGAAAAARLRHRGERARPARRHRPALRRRPGPAHPAGDPGRHRRGARRAARTARSPGTRSPRCSTPTRATPATWAWSGSGSCSASRRAALRRGAWPPCGPAPCSPRTRRCRPASTGSRSTWSGTTSPRRATATGRPRCCPACRWTGSSRSAPRTNPNMFNMAHMGLRLAQRANGVSRLHGAVSRGMFGGLWDGLRRRRGADRLGHQRRARPHLGGPRGHRADRGAGRRRRRRRCPTSSSGSCAGCCAPGWSARCAGGCGRRGCSAVPPPPSWAGPTTSSTRTC